jgi:2-polyprenyl-3-methyl-5-hydroxy-6-metoxy-1,4-benzoquinol methylase
MSKPSTGTCPACGDAQGIYYGTRNDYTLFTCPACALIYVYPMPSSTDEVYSEHYFTGASHGFGYTDYEREKDAMTPTFDRYLATIAAHQPPPGKALDVGAATGYFMERMRERGYAVTGVELSAYAAEAARRKGLTVHTGSLESVALPLESFDVVTMLDVFEHVPNPGELLDAANRVLKPGGLLALNTVDSASVVARILGPRWHLIVPPEHLLYPSAAWVATFASKHGFDHIASMKVGKTFPLPYVVSTFARWQKISWLEAWARRRRSGVLQHVRFPIHLRDTFFMIARKKAK